LREEGGRRTEEGGRRKEEGGRREEGDSEPALRGPYVFMLHICMLHIIHIFS
jgi:hypothetical protein